MADDKRHDVPLCILLWGLCCVVDWYFEKQDFELFGRCVCVAAFEVLSSFVPAFVASAAFFRV